MLMRLTKGTRDYILKSEREGYWDKRVDEEKKKIDDLQKDLNVLPADSESREEKEDQIKTAKQQLENLIKSAEKAKIILAKYGPIIWKLHSVDKETIKKEMSKIKISLGKFDDLRQNELTSSRLGYVGIMSYRICKLGIDGWENLRNIDEVDGEGNHKIIPFDQERIGLLPEDIATELANEISGTIGEDEITNLS